jgi:hypothetical protein
VIKRVLEIIDTSIVVKKMLMICHNIVVDERLSYSDSIELHKYLDRNAKERLSDTSNFVSNLTYVYDEHSWRSPKHRIKN